MISYRYYLHTKKELHVIKSCSGIVAALAVLFCCSWADAKSPSTSSLKLMADRPGSQGPEWVLYEDRNEDLDIVSFSQEGDSDGTLIVCQSDDGAVGSTEETQGGLVCRTASGAEESFYVLQLAEGVEDDGEAGGLAAKFHEKHGTGQAEESSATHFPFLLFDWNEEELKEIIVAIGETDAAKRMIEECADPSEQQMEACGISDNNSIGAWQARRCYDHFWCRIAFTYRNDNSWVVLDERTSGSGYWCAYK
jgi:hypothetical protein